MIHYKTEIIPDAPIEEVIIHNERCQNLKFLPSSIKSLKILKIIDSNIYNLVGLPLKLEFLESLTIRQDIFSKNNEENIQNSMQSLEGLPTELPSLVSLYISAINLSSFQFLPSSLPNLECFTIEITSGHKIILPKSMPKLKELTLHLHCETKLIFPKHLPNLQTFEIDGYFRDFSFLPRELPRLTSISFTNRPWECDGGEALDTQRRSLPQFHGKCPLMSLHGLPRSVIYDALLLLFDHFQEYGQDAFSTMSPHSIDQILRPPSPFNRACDFDKIYRLEDGHFYQYPVIDYYGEEYYEYDFRYTEIRDPRHTRFALEAEFLAYLDSIYDYFRKSPMELAQEYVTNTSQQIQSSPDITDRIIHEADYKVRQYLENSLPSDDNLLSQLRRCVAIDSSEDFSIQI